MGPWGFVFLAYGIVWVSLLLYLSVLWRRLRKAEAELSGLRSLRGSRIEDRW